MFRSQRGSALAWVILIVVLLLAAAAVLYLAVFKDDGKQAESANTGDATATQTQESQVGAGQGKADDNPSPVTPAPDQGKGQADPGSNVRSTTTVVAPPIDSKEEAFAAVLQSPEVLDWYWAVDDPRYGVTDEGTVYTVHLYSVVPAEGSAPEHDVDFGWYRVDKQTGTVSKIAK